MEQKKYIILFLLVYLIFILQTISAETTFNIETLKDHRVSLIIRESGKLATAESFHQNTGGGNLTFKSSVSFDLLEIILSLKKNGIEILDKKWTDINNGEEIFIKIIPGNVDLKYKSELQTDETQVTNETNITSETTENETTTNETIANETTKEAITQAIEENKTNTKEKDSNNFYYIFNYLFH